MEIDRNALDSLIGAIDAYIETVDSETTLTPAEIDRAKTLAALANARRIARNRPEAQRIRAAGSRPTYGRRWA